MYDTYIQHIYDTTCVCIYVCIYIYIYIRSVAMRCTKFRSRSFASIICRFTGKPGAVLPVKKVSELDIFHPAEGYRQK